MKFTKRNACITALSIGTITFVSAAAVGIASSNGYGVYKNALKKLVKAQNFTVEATGSVTVDGQQTDDSFYTVQKVNMADNASSTKEGTSPDDINYEFYCQDGFAIRGYKWTNDDGYIDEEYAKNRENGKMYYTLEDRNSYDAETETLASRFVGSDDNTADKFIRFAEIASDLVVGDLKNNFIYEGEENGISSYSISLDSFQIPEIITSGIDLLISANHSGDNIEYMKEWAQDDPLQYFYQNVAIDNVACSVKVDEDGNISDNLVTVKVTGDDWDGNNHEAVFSININCSDFGSTVPDRIDTENNPYLTRRSEMEAKRKAELEQLLAGDLSEADREQYEDELKWLTEGVG